MKRNILIQKGLHDTEVAVIENGQLVEYWTESGGGRRPCAVYKGRVTDVLSGLDACFVDIGLNKPAYLRREDLLYVKQLEHGQGRGAISQLVKRGDMLLVQINIEGGRNKGPKVTTNLHLPGQFLVYLPYGRKVTISRRITDNKERSRLASWGDAWLEEQEGLIFRTAARTADKDTLFKELKELRRTWAGVQQAASQQEGPGLLYKQDDLLEQVVRDFFQQGPVQCTVSNKQLYAWLKTKAESAPMQPVTLSLYTGQAPLFEAHGISGEISKLLQHRVWLKSGGYLVIDETEALTVIDVNTGRCTGKGEWEQTALHVNLEAAWELARQIRLRDIGGIIVIDFINLEEDTGRKQVLDTLEEALQADRKETHVVGYTALGLVELTRKRTNQSLWRRWTRLCPQCQGTGRVTIPMGERDGSQTEERKSSEGRPQY
ncbi:ribonuclease G [Caldalkalibacillus uzonensis]|uniref:Ribonuclease G n=1 Tax=Caldalkalibacillus uzonensis TaxID=353224 RepID=A0ABU0CSW3_9BACI|nr:Rne/Rng family ribonuclease [Caldalkalibacillus uzonensis]MDQ0339501.1 ribonuclease G [Caldalkalibacillus uzonensis]